MDKKMKFATICLLAYERPEMLDSCLKSLVETDAGFPYELIVHDDGSKDKRVRRIISNYAENISYVLWNCGKNRGIENAVKQSLKVSDGEYCFKIDTDIVFKDGWLAEAVKVLDLEQVGAVALLDYRNYDPDDERFHFIVDKPDYLESDNFVSSAYGFRREIYKKHGKEMKHDGWHKYLFRQGYTLAITKTDVVDNVGFGRSIYVGEDGKAVDMIDKPVIK